MRIWTHPWALKLESARQIERFIDSDDSLKDFVVGTDEEESEASEEMSWTSDESDNGKCFSFHFSRTNVKSLCTSFIHIFEGEICLRYVSIENLRCLINDMLGLHLFNLPKQLNLFNSVLTVVG
jgi:hypothetical protein